MTKTVHNNGMHRIMNKHGSRRARPFGAEDQTMKARLKADFEAEYVFLTREEGGRQAPPFQGYRCDFMYEGDPPEDGVFMIWPRFLNDEGNELPDGAPVAVSGMAQMFIVSPKLRGELHQKRIKEGTGFFMVEGTRKVAKGKVRRVLALHENPTQ